MEAFEGFKAAPSGVLLEALFGKLETVKKYGDLSKEFNVGLRENHKAVKRFVAETVSSNRADSIISSLERQIELGDELRDSVGELTVTQKKQMENFKSDLAILKAIRAEEQKIQQARLLFRTNAVLEAEGLSPLALKEKQLAMRKSELDHEREMNLIRTSSLAKQVALSDMTDPQTIKLLEALELEELKLDLLIEQTKLVQRQSDIYRVLAQDIRNAFENSLGKGFQDLITGAETSFRSFLNNIFQSMAQKMAQFLAQQMALSITSSIFGDKAGGLGSFFKTVFAANGAVFSGGFQAFAKGAPVVSKPTLGLVGEGRFNEAVVPLPDGKSIPIAGDLGGSTNNISVSVNIDGQGNSSIEAGGAGEQQAMDLGKVLGTVVRQQIATEMRPGGLLSRGR